jgi:lysophospholipase L1-like esterase
MIPQRIIVIGASSVYGRVDLNSGGWVGRLRKWHESKAPRNAVFNLGIGGDTTVDFLKRLKPESQARRPDLIIISIGLNDARRIGSSAGPNNTPKLKFQQNVRKIIETAKSITPKVVFVDVYPIDDSKTAPIPWGNNEYYLLSDVQEYRNLAKKIVISEKVPFLDIWSGWAKKGYKNLLYKDGLHPNDKGHQEIFLKLRNFLEVIYVKHH